MTGSDFSATDAGASTVFEVWRQDDNGNRFLMSRHPDRAAAEAVVAEMESGVQHKQLYSVHPAAPLPNQPT